MSWRVRLYAYASAAGLLGAAVASARDARPSTVAITIALSFFPYAAMLRTLRDGALISQREAWALVMTTGLLLVWAPPALSDDVFRYVWDGRVTASGVNPFRFAPDDPALASLRDAEVWPRINHPDVSTVYPPVAQALFAVAAVLGVTGMKLLAWLAHLSCIPAVARLRRGDGATVQSADVLIVGLLPLLLAEGALGGHVDMVVGACLVWCVVALRRARPGVAATFAAVAAGTKLLGLVMLPALARRDGGVRGALGATGLALFTLVCVLAFSTAGAGASRSGLGQYAQRWHGNTGVFALLEDGITQGLTQALPGEHGKLDLSPVRGPLEAAVALGFDPRTAWTEPKKALPPLLSLEPRAVARPLARALVLCLFALFATWLWWRRTDPLTMARHLVLAALLLAPQVHPWYLLWLLPLELAYRGTAGLVWAAAVLVAYAPLDGWVQARTWSESVWAVRLQYAAVFAALAFDILSRRGLPTVTAHNEPREAAAGSPA